MEKIYPLQLLKNRLAVYERAEKKSFEAWDNNQIDTETRLTHAVNNKPMIKAYQKAILTLTRKKK